MIIELFVYGKPRTAGSKSAFPNPDPNAEKKIILAPAGKYQKAWMDTVKWAFIQSKYYRMILWEGPIQIDLDFVFLRPKSHYRTGKYAGELKPNAPELKSTQPDKDKLNRAVNDALTGLVWRNDGQLAIGRTIKRYGEPEGVHIKIQQIKEYSWKV